MSVHLALVWVAMMLCVASLSSRVFGEESVDDSDVVVLTEKTFDDFIQQELVLVEFYAPWCGHCKSLAPEYAVAASELKELVPAVPLAKVDATVESSLASRYGVNGYPTLKIFRSGKASDYNGPRKSAGIVSYMKKQMGPAAKSLSTRSELDTFIRADKATNYAVVGFFQNSASKPSQLASSFALLSQRLRDDFNFARVNDEPELATKYGVTDDMKNEGVVVFLYGEPTVYTGSSKQKELEDFIRSSSTPLIGIITEQNQDLYTKRGLPLARVFMKTDGNLHSKSTKYFLNRLKPIADLVKDKMIVALAEKNDHKQMREHLNIVDDEVAFAIEEQGKQFRYEPEDDSKVGKFDAAGFKSFVEKYLDGDVKEYKRSQRAPKEQGPVKVVVGSTFDDIVFDDEKDVMIEFYAPWCGHCKSLEPKYNELATKLKKEDGVVIAKIDATANDFPRDQFEVKGYPTIFFKPAGKKAVLYEGGREVDDMLKFIKSKAKTMKKKGGGGKDNKKADKIKKKKKKLEEEDEEDD